MPLGDEGREVEWEGWNALMAGAIGRPHPAWTPFAMYCFELSTLQMDIGFIRTRVLDQYYHMLKIFDEEDSPDLLSHKKFLVTLAMDDVTHRLYAYQEKVFQLVNAALAAGFSEEDRGLRDKLRGWLVVNGEQAVCDCVGTLAKQPGVKEALERRRKLVHHLSEPDLDPKTLIAGGRRLFEEFQAVQQGDLDRLANSLDVDHYRKRLDQKLERIEQELEAFEERMSRALAGSLAKRGWFQESTSER